MSKTEDEHRQEIVEIGRRLYQQGFVAATDGNISVLLAYAAHWEVADRICLWDSLDYVDAVGPSS